MRTPTAHVFISRNIFCSDRPDNLSVFKIGVQDKGIGTLDLGFAVPLAFHVITPGNRAIGILLCAGAMFAPPLHPAFITGIFLAIDVPQQNPIAVGIPVLARATPANRFIGNGTGIEYAAIRVADSLIGWWLGFSAGNPRE
ncbi:MAG: hypothetical protein K2X55_05255 [Burkholderiaceae bacterium]|nr:hypothetical protein [Burkholderiaceae bacterium]